MNDTRRPPVAEDTLAALLDRAARRSRLSHLLERALLGLALLLLLAAAAVLVIEARRFEPALVESLRVGLWLLGGAALVLLAGTALARRISPADSARRLERLLPGLDGALITAAEGLQRRDGLWPALRAEALRACRAGDVAELADRAALRRRAGLLLALLAAATLAFALAPPGLRHAAALLLPGAGPERTSPYSLALAPGSTRLLAGSDLRVLATPRGYAADEALLLWRPRGETGWRQVPMPAAAGGDFEAFLFEVSAPLEYRAVADGVASLTHAVEVLPRPQVQRLDLAYRYPDYSGLAPRTETDGGPIAGVRGTAVRVEAHTRDAVAGRLRLDDERSLPMRRGEDGLLSATLSLTADGRYRVELQAADGQWLAATPDYPVRAAPDTPPVVRIERPGRDVTVTSIEELEVAVSASDDLAVRDLELVLSVNGEPAEALPLRADGTARIESATWLMLEQRGLEPGDLVALHARAGDGRPLPQARASSDLYFLEVRPFDREYRRAQSGGGGGGGAEELQSGLAEQQRELVVALFNVSRDTGLEADQRRQRSALLAQAQARVRDRTEAIVRRLGSRSVVEMNPGYRAMAEELPRAAAAMLRVEALLAGDGLGESLEPARLALRHLQRADAAFREVQVANRSGAAQGDAAAEAGDLANLFALEMDRFRNQYSEVQRGSWNSAGDPRADEIAERLRELAARQQREVERLRQRAAAGETGGTDSQRLLAETLERLERRLERLRLEQPRSPLLGEAEASLAEARRAMRQAAEEGSESRAGEAAENLRAAERALEGSGGERLAAEVVAARDEARRLEEVQRDLEARVRAGLEQGVAEAVPARKERLVDETTALRHEVERLALRSRAADAAAARALREAAQALQGDEVGPGIRRRAERMRENPRAIDLHGEMALTEALAEAGRQLAKAAASLATGGDRETGGRSPVERLAGLIAELEDLQARLEQGEPAAGARAGGIGGDAWADAPYAERLQQQARLLEAVRGELRRGDGTARDISAVIDGLLDLAGDGLASLAHRRERHAELLEDLRALRERLAAPGEPPAALSARRDAPPPPGWEASVREYYRRLALDPDAENGTGNPSFE